MYTKENNKTNKNLELREDLFCPHCGKQCKNLNSLAQHKIRCRKNPDKIESAWLCGKYLKNRGWSKGLTKETDSRVASISKGIKTSTKRRHSGRANTEEAEVLRRKKISETMRKNGRAGGKRAGSGRGNKGWYKNYYCDSTYELVYVIYNLDHNIKFDRCNLVYKYSYNNKEHLYYPDFILEDGSLVEIKGYYTEQVGAKINAVKDREIKVLYEKDLKYAFDYVKENYNYKKLKDLYEDRSSQEK